MLISLESEMEGLMGHSHALRTHYPWYDTYAYKDDMVILQTPSVTRKPKIPATETSKTAVRTGGDPETQSSYSEHRSDIRLRGLLHAGRLITQDLSAIHAQDVW